MASESVILDCARLEEAGVAGIDYIARLKLGLGRSGRKVRLARASKDLLGLIELCGLAEALRVEVEGQTEKREEPGGVEEERELGDPAF